MSTTEDRIESLENQLRDQQERFASSSSKSVVSVDGTSHLVRWLSSVD